MTKQRQVIMRILMGSDEHLTAEQIFILAIEQMPSIAMATVYRNLNLMVQAGEIRRVSVLNAPDRFDRITLPHNHLICDKCGTFTDVSLPELKGLLEEKVHEPILSYELNIHYICPECKKKSNK
ncbi:MAG: Fur family transcriptional regulator [Clostridium sp.]